MKYGDDHGRISMTRRKLLASASLMAGGLLAGEPLLRTLFAVGDHPGILSGSARAAEGKTFRWAFQSDAVSMDPYHINETMTLGFLGNIYEGLVRRGPNLEIEPALATEWTTVEPNVWRFKLREGVTFHDGSPFSADDVIFSLQRVRSEGSDLKAFVASITEIRKQDDFTIDIVTDGPNPILTSEIGFWYIMSHKWAEKHGATDVGKLAAGEENYATLHANGTGPFMLKTRQPGVKTVLAPNPDWWDDATHNVAEAVFTPVKSAPTRVANLLAGQLEMMYPVPLQDVKRVNGTSGMQVLQNPELRTIFLGFDVHRDELLYSSVEGKNPFKDPRVRKAFYQAVDIAAIKKVVMRGASNPTALMVGPGINGFNEELNERYPHDPEAAMQLLAEAGYPDGFEVVFDVPNDRYVNDESIGEAVAAMLSKIGITVKLNAQTKAKHFQKITARDTSFYLLGWTPNTYDMLNCFYYNVMTPAELDTSGKAGEGQGQWNCGNYSNPEVDALCRRIAVEIDADKRQQLIDEAMRLHKEDVGHLPLHQQALSWGIKEEVDLVQSPDNTLSLRWVKIG